MDYSEVRSGFHVVWKETVCCYLGVVVLLISNTVLLLGWLWLLKFAR